MLALSNGGSIVNTSSFVARAGQSGASIYAASKSALEGMVRALAIEVGGQNIRINNVLPGAIDTPMYAGLGGDAATSPSGSHRTRQGSSQARACSSTGIAIPGIR
jgi:NAD(P)-dependent dehydrogenase (short-subunit alcohol dehydrogenase family)